MNPFRAIEQTQGVPEVLLDQVNIDLGRSYPLVPARCGDGSNQGISADNDTRTVFTGGNCLVQELKADKFRRSRTERTSKKVYTRKEMHQEILRVTASRNAYLERKSKRENKIKKNKKYKNQKQNKDLPPFEVQKLFEKQEARYKRGLCSKPNRRMFFDTYGFTGDEVTEEKELNDLFDEKLSITDNIRRKPTPSGIVLSKSKFKRKTNIVNKIVRTEMKTRFLLKEDNKMFDEPSQSMIDAFQKRKDREVVTESEFKIDDLIDLIDRPIIPLRAISSDLPLSHFPHYHPTFWRNDIMDLYASSPQPTYGVELKTIDFTNEDRRAIRETPMFCPMYDSDNSDSSCLSMQDDFLTNRYINAGESSHHESDSSMPSLRGDSDSDLNDVFTESKHIYIHNPPTKQLELLDPTIFDEPQYPIYYQMEDKTIKNYDIPIWKHEYPYEFEGYELWGPHDAWISGGQLHCRINNRLVVIFLENDVVCEWIYPKHVYVERDIHNKPFEESEYVDIFEIIQRDDAVTEGKYEDDITSNIKSTFSTDPDWVAPPGFFDARLPIKHMEEKEDIAKCIPDNPKVKELFQKMKDNAMIHRLHMSQKEKKVHRSFMTTLKEMLAPLANFDLLNNMITPLVTLIYQIVRSRNALDVVAAMTQFAGIFVRDESLIPNWMKPKLTINAILAKFTRSVESLEELTPLKSDIVTESMFDGANTISETLDVVRRLLSTILHSEFAELIKNTIIGMASLHWFSRDFANSIYSNVGPKIKMKTIDLLEATLAGLSTIIKFGESMWEGRPLREIFMGSNPLGAMHTRARELLYYKDKTYSGLPVEGKICYREFIIQAKEIIDLSEKLLYPMNPTQQIVIDTKKLVYELKEAELKVRLENNRKMRQMPLGIILNGDPGVGKSLMVRFLCELHSVLCGRKFDVTQIYDKDNGEYWEAHDPPAHPYIHFSELGTLHKDIISKIGDEILMELTKIMDSLPHLLNMAFNEKGKVYCNPDMVIGDTNLPHLPFNKFVSNPGAFLRRFLFVEQVVKDEYRESGGTGLDVKKSINSNELLLNKFWFKAKKYVPRGNMDDEDCYVSLHPHKIWIDIFELVQILSGLMMEHMQSQKRVFDRVSSGSDPTLYMNFQRQEDVEEIPMWLEVPEVKEVAVTEGAQLAGKYLEVKRLIQEKKSTPMFKFLERAGGIFKYGAIATSEYIRGFIINPIKVHMQYSWDIAPHQYSWIKLYTVSHTKMLGLNILSWWLEKSTPEPEPTSWYTFIIIMLLFLMIIKIPSYALFWMYALVYVLMKYTPMNATLANRGVKFRLSSSINVHKARIDNLWKCDPDFNPLVSKWWLVYGAAFSAALVLTYKAMRAIVPDEKRVTEAHSEFKFDEDISRRINIMEEVVGAGVSIKPVAVVNKAHWNVQEIVNPPSVHTGGLDELMLSALRNVRKCEVMTTKGTITTHVFGVEGNYAILNTHAFQGDRGGQINVTTTGSLKNTLITKNTLVREENTVHLPNDITVVALDGINFNDKMKHIIDFKPHEGSYNGSYWKGQDDYKVRTEYVNLPFTIGDIPTGGDITISSYWTYKYASHKSGDCGKPLIVQTSNGSCIAGIHTGGSLSSERCYATLLDRNTIKEAINELQSRTLKFKISSVGDAKTESLMEPARKSPFRYEILHGITYYGRQAGDILINNHSSLKNTLCSKEVLKICKESFNYKQDVMFRPPVMKPYTTASGKYISPYNLGLNKMSSQRKALDPAVMEKVIAYITNHFVTELKKKGVVSLAPLTVEQAINGVVEDAFIKRVNASTSAGAGYPGLKAEYIPIVTDDEKGVVREPVRKLKEHLYETLTCYSQSKTVGSITKVQLKDEPREISKVIAGKTRLFYIAPLDSLIISRMFLSPFYSLMVQFEDVFCCALGANMFTDAGKYKDRLNSFSELIMEGDYGSYDQTMAFLIGHAASSIVINVLKAFGYNAEALIVCESLFTDLMFPILEMCKDIFSVPGLQPSGRYATAEDNTLRGLVIMVYNWMITLQTRDLDFFTYVRPLLYGDDMLAAVKESVSQWYNNISYQMLCRDYVGLEFTPASKTGVMIPFMNIESCSFLKRRFVFKEDQNRWVAQLDIHSIVRSLIWYLPSKTVSPDIQFKSTINSALWEFGMHFDEKEYENIRQQLVTLFGDAYMHGDTFDTPSYKEICEKLCPDRDGVSDVTSDWILDHMVCGTLDDPAIAGQ